MYINAYSTVRDEIHADYAQQRAAGDPEMAEHLHGFTGYVWDRGGEEMTAGMWSLIRHIGDTRRQYVFERDDLRGLEEWAARTNSIFFAPDGRVVDAAGTDLIADPSARAIPFHPAALERARRIRASLTSPVPDHYPPVRSEHEAIVRSPAEVADRLLSIIAVSELAGHFLAGRQAPLAGLRQVLPGAFATFSPNERRFVDLLESGADAGAAGPANDEARALATQLQWTALAAMMLAHALQMLRIPVGAAADRAVTDPGPMIKWVADVGETGVRDWATELAPLPGLCDMHEYVHCMRWIAVDESLHPDEPATIDEATAATLLEWHRALSWLFHPDSEWDEVDLST
ncbi:DUF4272 domain-containing protein [uncultured Corynebacterium sp.]|uniref:DUF4272 domain-containing protein n=1 Tax=uncultured Corynebacterium sp. TaxID=159447 RepID=UPI0025DEA89B|nr:DUF4272 domain-containing protein [uncultured Corynebacterium sp.]